MKFRLRVDEKTEETGTLLLSMIRKYPHVLVKHVLPHGNPHFHAYVFADDVKSCPSYRYTIDQTLGVSGAERSVKKCDDDKIDDYVQYLFNEKHGNRWTLISHTFDVDIHVQKAKAVAAAFADRQEKSRVITEWDMAEELRSRVENQSNDLDRSAVIELAIQIRNTHRKTFNDHVLAKMIQTALSTIPRWKHYVIQKAFSRVFGND